MPRTARLINKGEKTAYHIISRTALDGFPFGDVEKDELIKIIKRISALFFVEVFGFCIRDRKRSEARSILCFWATEELGMTQSRLAEKLDLTPPAISHAVRRGRISVEKNSYSILEPQFTFIHVCPHVSPYDENKYCDLFSSHYNDINSIFFIGVQYNENNRTGNLFKENKAAHWKKHHQGADRTEKSGKKLSHEAGQR